jgi:hypothetical protein
VLYGCGAWSLTLREECRIRVFDNSILMRIFEPKRVDNGEWRRLHSEEHYNLYRSHNIVRAIQSRILRWTGHGATMEAGMSAFKISNVKHRGKLRHKKISKSCCISHNGNVTSMMAGLTNNLY